VLLKNCFIICGISLLFRENERQSAPDVVVVDTVEAHEVSANVTVETSVPAKTRSQSDHHLINFGLAVPHDILLGRNIILWGATVAKSKECRKINEIWGVGGGSWVLHQLG
jgi:hypothetical protein